MDWSQLSSEWLRAVRGRRSQRAASRRLGYGSNIFSRWETGRCAPRASDAFRAAHRFGVNVERAELGFLGLPAHEQGGLPSLATKAGVHELLLRLKGETSFVDLAARTRFNRFVLSRWFRGQTEPRLPELLELIDAMTERLLDFVAGFCDPALLPSLEGAWRTHLALRDAAFDAPWSHAVLRVLELAEYARRGKHERGFIASRLGITTKEEDRCLSLLERSRQIEKRDGRWVVSKQGTIDTGQDPQRARELRRFWQAQALQRFDAGARGTFGYNLFTISERDYEALKKLYVQYFEGMRALVAKSSPGEKLVLFCGQIVELDGRREAVSSNA
jgi:hypothetical protein